MSVSIPARFNGPLHSGNGGYSAGVVASFIDGAAEVTLRRPVPLDSQLEIAHAEDGSVQLMDGESLVAEGRAAPAFELQVPPPVSADDARRAVSRYRGLEDGVFSRCFVCGRAREDCFEVFAGEVDEQQLVASPWTPPAWAADAGGTVRPEFVWAVLDCPTYFAVHIGRELSGSVLARLTARLDGPVTAGSEHVVMAWPIESEGRKHHAGAAVLSAEGEPLAVALALLIEPRTPTD